MNKIEFKNFMNLQIVEINNYLKTKSYNNAIEKNSLVFEWIELNAANFRKRWNA